jgi:hypothetical protein
MNPENALFSALRGCPASGHGQRELKIENRVWWASMLEHILLYDNPTMGEI